MRNTNRDTFQRLTNLFLKHASKSESTHDTVQLIDLTRKKKFVILQFAPIYIWWYNEMITITSISNRVFFFLII